MTRQNFIKLALGGLLAATLGCGGDDPTRYFFRKKRRPKYRPKPTPVPTPTPKFTLRIRTSYGTEPVHWRMNRDG